ncbi:TPA: hypothetical protein ACOFCN_000306 [Stenotrophomonas maltophilia]|uniref:hypothetical protein n=1 Tax=Stenotrophomonas maltophilia TaxID=40324 RepID=UPI0039C2D0E0
MNKVKLVATWTRVYWADPKHYKGCDTPEDMAQLDQDAGSPMDIMDREDSNFTVTVAPEESA